MRFTDEQYEICRLSNQVAELKNELEINSDVTADTEDDARRYRFLVNSGMLDDIAAIVFSCQRECLSLRIDAAMNQEHRG